MVLTAAHESALGPRRREGGSSVFDSRNREDAKKTLHQEDELPLEPSEFNASLTARSAMEPSKLVDRGRAVRRVAAKLVAIARNEKKHRVPSRKRFSCEHQHNVEMERGETQRMSDASLRAHAPPKKRQLEGSTSYRRLVKRRKTAGGSAWSQLDSDAAPSVGTIIYTLFNVQDTQRWYLGYITRVHPNNTCDVRYSDGDEYTQLARDKLWSTPSSRSSKPDAVSPRREPLLSSNDPSLYNEHQQQVQSLGALLSISEIGPPALRRLDTNSTDHTVERAGDWMTWSSSMDTRGTSSSCMDIGSGSSPYSVSAADRQRTTAA